MTRDRAFIAGLLATVLLAACGSSGPSVGAIAGTAASATPSASGPTSALTASPSAAVTASAPPSAQTMPTDAAAFWTIAGTALRNAQRVRLIAKGPSPVEIRFEPNRSATILVDMPVFVCLDGVAYDGQNGFEPTPGPWSCGIDAFVDGFRHLGQPVDAWSQELEGSKHIKETVGADADGTWRWDYAADSPQYGGPVTASVWLDPSTGRIVKASRKDPIGKSTWTVEYGATFPPVALPGS
jgi:hypothetical protein